MHWPRRMPCRPVWKTLRGRTRHVASSSCPGEFCYETQVNVRARTEPTRLLGISCVEQQCPSLLLFPQHNTHARARLDHGNVDDQVRLVGDVCFPNPEVSAPFPAAGGDVAALGAKARCANDLIHVLRKGSREIWSRENVEHTGFRDQTKKKPECPFQTRRGNLRPQRLARHENGVLAGSFEKSRPKNPAPRPFRTDFFS